MDSATSRDLDDALRIEPRAEGGWRVHAYIAAPGLAQNIDDVTLEQALERRHTRYLPHGRTIPMLGVENEERYSLLPKQPREAMLIACSVDRDGALLDTETHVACVSFMSTQRYVYDDPAKNPELFREERAFAMCRILARRRRGALTFVDLEQGIYTDEHGKVHKLVKREEVIGHLIIQESMILANEALATWCASRGVRAVFRVHNGPNNADPAMQDALEDFMERAITEQDQTSLDLLESTFANNMSAAYYSSSPGAHWALQLPAYMHATSPLRRVHDLIAQMQIVAYLEQRPLPIGWHELEQLLERLQREQDNEDQATISRFKRRDEALFLEQLLGDETLSSKQMRRAIRYMLRHPKKEELEPSILARVEEVLQKANDHPSQTVPVALLDVLLESEWGTGHELARDFLDAHDSGWKQLRAHAMALRPDVCWWELYSLDDDPVERARQALDEARARDLEAQRLERRQRQHAKRRELDPMSRHNDLKNRGIIDSTFRFESEQKEGHNSWSGELEVTHVPSGTTQHFEFSAGSKKGVKRTLITQAIAWFDAHHVPKN